MFKIIPENIVRTMNGDQSLREFADTLTRSVAALAPPGYHASVCETAGRSRVQLRLLHGSPD